MKTPNLTFKVFLSEQRAFAELTMDQVLEHFKTDFSESTSLFHNMLYRGSKDNTPNMTMLKAAETDRTPLIGGRFYTPLIDSNPKNQGWPKRTRSTICSLASEIAVKYTDKFTEGSKLYCVFPKNGAKIGVLPTYDMWRVQINFPKGERSLSSTDTLLLDLLDEPGGLTTANLLDRLNKTGNQTAMKISLMLNHSDVEDAFSLQEMGCRLVSIEEMSTVENTGDAECWFEGPCILLRPQDAMQVKQMLKGEEE